MAGCHKCEDSRRIEEKEEKGHRKAGRRKRREGSEKSGRRKTKRRVKRSG